MSLKNIKNERDVLRWVVIVTTIFTAWFWMIEVPGTRGIINDWKYLHDQAYLKDAKISADISVINTSLDRIDGIILNHLPAKDKIVLKSEIMDACFKGGKTYGK